MRYYLDTNIVVFLLVDRDSIDKDIWEILSDYDTVLYISAVAANEVIHLYKRNKIKESRFKTAGDILTAIEKLGIQIKPLTEHHITQYAGLEVNTEKHNDPSDHAIIAQAISDKIPIISSDTKFKLYTTQGLNFIYNLK